MVVVAPLPAVTAQDVSIEVRPGDPPTMRFWAHVRSAGPRDYLVHEWEYGGYERQIDIPAGYGSTRRGHAAQRPARRAPAQGRRQRPSHDLTDLTSPLECSAGTRVPEAGMTDARCDTRPSRQALGCGQPRLEERG